MLNASIGIGVTSTLAYLAYAGAISAIIVNIILITATFTALCWLLVPLVRVEHMAACPAAPNLEGTTREPVCRPWLIYLLPSFYVAFLSNHAS